MIESMLEPHLRSTGETQSQVGITFLILGGVYMVTTPIAGYVSLFYEIHIWKMILARNFEFMSFLKKVTHTTNIFQLSDFETMMLLGLLTFPPLFKVC